MNYNISLRLCLELVYGDFQLNHGYDHKNDIFRYLWSLFVFFIIHHSLLELTINHIL